MAQAAYIPYWWSAFLDDKATVNSWAGLDNYNGQLAEMAIHQMLTAFYDTTADQVEYRRTLLYHYLAGPFGTESDDALTLFAKSLPVQSFVPKVVNNLCIAYNQAPERSWKKGETVDANATKQYRQLYEQMGADGRLQTAYRYMKLCSGVAIRPYVGGKGRMQLEILTPNLFRYRTRALYPDMLEEFVLPLLEVYKGKERNVFEVWTAERHYFMDDKGRETDFRSDFAKPLTGEDNPYKGPDGVGRIPYMIARLVEPNTMQTFGAGLLDVVEANLAANAYQWLADHSIMFESFGVWVATNMGLSNESKARLGFGKMIAVDGVDKEAAESRLDNTSTNGQYSAMIEYKKTRVEEAERNTGLPNDVVSGDADALSGVSRALKRKELDEQRRTDLPLLKTMEVELSDVVTVVHNTDVVKRLRDRGERAPLALPTGLTLDVEFKDEPIINDPATQFVEDTKAFLAGLTTATDYVKSWSGKTFETEAAAIEYITERQIVSSRVRPAIAAAIGQTNEGVTLPQPIDPTADVTEEAPAVERGVGDKLAVISVQEKFYAGTIPLKAAIATLVEVYQFTEAEALRLLPPKPPEPTVAPTAAPSVAPAPFTNGVSNG